MIVIATPLTQWDTGRSVTIQNIVATHVHFANKGDSQAVIMALENSQAKIPDYLLQTGKELCVYAVSEGVTIEKKSFFVTKRERPENYVYEDDTRNYIYSLIQDAEDATEAANQTAQDLLEAKERGEFNGPKGDKGDKGDPGSTVDDTKIGNDPWSSRKIIETLCPPIEESGMVMQCYPLEGTLLNVMWDSDNVNEMHICGKNLYNKTAYPLKNNQIIRHEYGTYASSGIFAATEKYIPCMHLQGQTISIRHAPRVTENNITTGGGIAFYKEDQSYLSGSNMSQVTVPDEAAYFRFCINKNYVSEAQIELGSAVTEYEPYIGKESFVDGVLMEGIFQPINGLNTIWLTNGASAYDGTVTGSADPKAEINRLKEIIGATSVATSKEE